MHLAASHIARSVHCKPPKAVRHLTGHNAATGTFNARLGCRPKSVQGRRVAAAASHLSRSPREHIEELACAFNPEDVEHLPAKTQQSIKELRQQLDKSVNRLSGELYARDAHCVLELVQNADDNTYSADVLPTLELEVRQDAISVQNNECGFTAANVEAICRIGESTKTKAQGYIGEKGIGFKSVFKVADEVCINSNGYSFAFDARRELGMVEPQWRDDLPLEHCKADWTTITLMLRDGIDQKRLEQQCGDVHPFLLLFLKKLRRLEVTACGTTKVFELSRVGQQVTITVTDGAASVPIVHHFYIHTTTVHMPKHLQVKPREGVASTDLVFAFPLDAEGAALTSSSQMVHAFLPVRDYGFKFLIQADFIVPSSREAIDEDSPWNTWLQQQLASAFQQALLSMQHQQPALRASYLNYVPMKGQVSSSAFFSQLADSMLSDTRGAAVFQTSDGQYSTAAKVLQPTDSFSYGPEQQPLVSNAQLAAALGMHYLREDVAARVSSSTLQALGCRPFGMSDLLSVCAKQGSGGICDPSWFQGLYAALRHGPRGLLSEVLSLRAANVFLLQDGSVTSAEGVYLLSNSMAKFKQLLPAGTAASLKVLHGDSYSASDRQLLAAWGIDQLSEERHLVPAVLVLYKPRTPAVTKAQHLDQLRFLYKLRSSDAVMSQACAHIKLLTTGGDWAAAASLYASAAGSGWSLQSLLPDANFLAPLYSKLSKDQQAWLQSGLNVAAMLRVDAGTGQLSAEFKELLGQPSRSVELLCMLRDCHSSYMQQLQQGSGRYRATPSSSFKEALEDMQVYDDADGAVHSLCDCYLRNKAMQCLIDENTPCVDVPDPDSSTWSFLSELRVSREATVPTYLKRLQQLSDDDAEVPTDAVVNIYSFLSSQFADHGASIRKAFEAECLIYLPPQATTNSSGSSDCIWASPGAVLWRGNADIFGNQVFLSSVEEYAELKDFFMQQLGVRNARDEDLIGALLHRVSEAPTIPSKEDMQVVLTILKELSRWVGSGGAAASSAVSALLQKPVLPVRLGGTSAGFASADGSVYVCRSEQVEAIFGGAVNVLDVPCEQLSLLRHLLSCASGNRTIRDICDVLEEVTVWDLESQEQLVDGYIQELQQAAPLLSRCLHHTDIDDFMAQWKSGRLLQLTSGLRLYAVSELHTIQTFGGIEHSQPQLVTSECSTDGSMHIYISKKQLSRDKKAVRMPLHMLYSNLWSSKHEFSSLGTAVLAYGPQAAEQHLQREGITELPPELSCLGLSSRSTVYIGNSSEQNEVAVHPSSSSSTSTGTSSSTSRSTSSSTSSSASSSTTTGTTSSSTSSSSTSSSKDSISLTGTVQQQGAGAGALSCALTGSARQRPSVLRQPFLEDSLSEPGSFSSSSASNRTRGPNPGSRTLQQFETQGADDYDLAAGELQLECGASEVLCERQQVIVQTVRAAPAVSWANLTAAQPKQQQKIKALPPRAIGRPVTPRPRTARAAGTAAQRAGPGRGQLHKAHSPAARPSFHPPSRAREPITALASRIMTQIASSQGTGAAQAAPPPASVTDDIGYCGEVLVFEELRKLLPDFGPDNWTSDARCRYGLSNDHIDAGSDFVYQDVGGMLTKGTAMAGKSPLCFIEVKTTTGDGANAFFISDREWEVARQLEWGRGGKDIPALYMIIRVAGIYSSSPHIHRVLLDPAGMLRRGELDLTGSNLSIERFA